MRNFRNIDFDKEIQEQIFLDFDAADESRPFRLNFDSRVVISLKQSKESLSSGFSQSDVEVPLAPRGFHRCKFQFRVHGSPYLLEPSVHGSK